MSPWTRRLLGILGRAFVVGALAALTMGKAGDAQGVQLVYAFGVPFFTWLAGAYEVDIRQLGRRPAQED